MNRKITKTIRVRGVPIGGGNPIPVQSMTNTHTDDVAATLAQLRRLEAAGCEIVRLAVPNQLAARALPEIRRGTGLPLVADIHFDYRLRWRRASTRSASTPATSALRSGCVWWRTPAATMVSPSASA